MLTPTKPVKSCECGGSCGDCCCCTKESIGLGNVDNTSDLNKPLSRDMVNALSGKVDLNIFTQLKNRVLALENTITEIPDLKVRISECELDIKDHYEAIKRLQSTTKSMADTITELGNRVTGVNDGLVTVGTRVDALETKDSNNVKLSGVNVQTIQGTLKANDPSSGATDKTLVTANWVSQTGNDAPNNLAHKSGAETIDGDKTFRRQIIGVQFQLASFGSNDITGWYAICKLPKFARELYLRCYSPNTMNIVIIETNTHVINVIKWRGKYESIQNKFMLVETDSNIILYVYSPTYMTNIINIINYSVYGAQIPLSEIDMSVFTNNPVTKPTIGGEIIATYDEALFNLVTS